MHHTKQRQTRLNKDPEMVARAALEDLKGREIVSISLKNSYAETLVIATGTSERHVHALADRVADYFRKAHLTVHAIEGTPNNRWVIVDCGDTVVHIFTEETRALYNLEKLYAHDFEDD